MTASGSPLSEDERLIGDRYKASKVPDELDCVVIGSGVGGLFTAALLAKAGQRVLVLEAHSVAGGCTHEFEKKGFDFDTGLHYVGKSAQLLDLVSEPSRRIDWVQMGDAASGHVYDRICLAGDEPFSMRAGRDNLLADLTARHPADAAALRRYFDLVDAVAGQLTTHLMLKLLPVAVQRLLEPWLCPLLVRHSGDSAQRVVDAHFGHNRPLAALLLAQFGDIGLLPERAPFALHAAVFRHYFNGGYYPRGGSQNIARALVPTIEAAGGRVLVKAYVERILVDDVSVDGVSTPTAVGVRLRGGDVITARRVVSAAGVRNTYLKLLDPDVVRRAALPVEQIERIGPSVGHVYCFVGLRGSAAELQLPSHNDWLLPHVDYDLNAGVRRFRADPLDPDQPPFVFMSFPSVKDGRTAADRSTCLLITEADAQHFAALAVPGSRKGKRGDDYKQEKDRWQQRLLEALYQRYPRCRDRVVYVTSGSPLTNSHYLNAMSGESYGLSMAPERYTVQQSYLTRPTVDAIANLYLAGQDVVSAGIAGAMAGGLLAAHAVLGYGTILDVITGRNLIKDLKNLNQKKNQ